MPQFYLRYRQRTAAGVKLANEDEVLVVFKLAEPTVNVR